MERLPNRCYEYTKSATNMSLVYVCLWAYAYAFTQDHLVAHIRRTLRVPWQRLVERLL
jgi:hypothetical protein